MRARHLKLLALALALAAVLPIDGDAAIPVPPASQAPCCNTADQIPSPAPTGDEIFFNIPGGVPNVMVLLDSSGSMMDMPQTIRFPNTATFAVNGSCDSTVDPMPTASDPYPRAWLDDAAAKAIANPQPAAEPAYTTYTDVSHTVTAMVNNPPWTSACTTQARPTTDKAVDTCLFRPTSYFKISSSSGTPGTIQVEGATLTSAYAYNAPDPILGGPSAGRCASIDTGGNVVGMAPNTAQCKSCLDTKGYYLFKSSGGVYQAVFTGTFLNQFPPKYVAARRAVKDLVRLDPEKPADFDQVRFGLTIFNPSADSSTTRSTGVKSTDGGALIVPLGPNCDDSFPAKQSSFLAARQAIVNSVNNTSLVRFSSFTPLAESLFNIGQYFSNTGSSALYQSLFGSTWMKTSGTNAAQNFSETSAGQANASWTGAGKNQHSFCWACQQASIVVVTDGEPTGDTNLPKGSSGSSTAHTTFNNDFINWTSPAVISGNSAVDAFLMHRVSYFLANTDLRPDLANGARPQTVATYTVSFGIDPGSTADLLLDKVAKNGGGLYANTGSAEALKDALDRAVSDTVKRSTSFSSANANALQTSKTSGVDSYLGRFRPTNASFWEGHLFAAGIFDEFGEGCDEGFGTAGQALVSCGVKADGTPFKTDQNPNMDGDEDGASGKAICKSAYVIDRECSPIIEDATGNFKKGAFDAATHQLLSTPDDAKLFWDAGRVLSDPNQPGYRSADEAATNARTIYTVVDVTGDGKFTSADGLVAFTADNAAALAPLMDLQAAGQTTTALPTAGTPAAVPWCNSWLNRIGVCGATPLPACPSTAALVRAKCAEHIINFYRGWDVMDWDGDHCAGPGNYYNTNGWGSCTTSAQCGTSATCNASGKCVTTGCAGGEQRDRTADSRATNAQEFWKLGDIFHSSPVLVRPPVDKLRCKLGVDNQCVLTLFSALGTSATNTTPLEKYGVLDAYDQYRKDNLNIRQMVVVGANDGMLHAFDAGVANTSKTPNSEGQYPYTPGQGEELWAFVPPEMLPHLWQGIDQHRYFVDGNTMIRDVWYDKNGDGTKQKDEFKTIAVITERGGGTHFTALDISDRANPKFLWTFPQVCSEDSKLIGQTFSYFPPRPPPIVPIRLKLPAASGRDPQNRGWEERWVVVLNGGYDPTLVRGRAVWIVDAVTGGVLWRWTDADFKAMRGDTKGSMMPVAATIGAMDIGKADQPGGIPDTDGFFDTLTWGDLGGNVFVARIHDPGELDANGLVTNWTAARTFEPNRQADDTHKATGRGDYYFMTSNFLDGASRLLTLLGSGNLEQLMVKENTCGPNNVLGCCASGCTVAQAVASSTYGTGSCTQGGTFQCSGGVVTYTPATTTGCASGFACGTTDQKVTLTFNCGAAGSPTPFSAEVTCGADGICTTEGQFSSNAAFSTTALGQPNPQNRFYAIWSYGKYAWKLFTNATEALAFDKKRFTDVPFTGCGATGTDSCQLQETSSAQVADAGTGMGIQTTCRDGTTKCWANPEDNGWMYSYGKYCPLASCATATWTDEKTGSAPTVFRGCADWSGFRPIGGGGGNDPCTASTGTPTSIAYRMDAKSGTPRAYCGYDGTLSSRAAIFAGRQKDAYAPPQSGSLRVVVNQKGQINYSTLKIETGSPAEKQSLGTRSSVSEPLYWLEVPREVHSCRHVDPTTCQ